MNIQKIKFNDLVCVHLSKQKGDLLSKMPDIKTFLVAFIPVFNQASNSYYCQIIWKKKFGAKKNKNKKGNNLAFFLLYINKKCHFTIRKKVIWEVKKN